LKIRNQIKLCLIALLVLTGQLIHSSNNSIFSIESKLGSIILQEQDSTLYKKYAVADSLNQVKNYSMALRVAFEILDQADASKDFELISNTNYLIGRLWYQTESYENAVKYFKLSLKGFSEIIEQNNIQFSDLGSGDALSGKNGYLNSNFDLGKSYQKLFEGLISKQQSGAQELSKTDSINKIIYKDSTLYYYNRIVESADLSEPSAKFKARAYNNLSGIYIRDSLLDIAEDYALKSLEMKKLLNDQYSLAIGYNALSNVYYLKQQYEDSKQALFDGLKSLENIKGERIDKLKAGLYLNVAYSMYRLKDYHAYEYQKKSWELYDKLDEVENERVLTGIEAERNYEKGIQQGIMLEEIKRQKVKRNTWILGISSFFIIVLLVFFLNQYKLRQKNLSLELSKQELIQQQKLEKIKAESQIRILNATLDGKESERKQIAETLHDSVSALLSSANLHLQACKTQFNGSTPIEVDKSQSIINEASQKIRDLSHTLVSSILLKFGLSFAIKDIAEKFSNSELKIDYDTRYIQRYDQGFEIKLYNIIQEFINNILKHSHASHAKITLVEKKKKLHLIIEDNGQGFDVNQIPEKDGLGINQIDARIQMMKGKFTIETAKGKGTKIIIELPVFEKETISII
jgi:signal transduction histidine kinase